MTKAKEKVVLYKSMVKVGNKGVVINAPFAIYQKGRTLGQVPIYTPFEIKKWKLLDFDFVEKKDEDGFDCIMGGEYGTYFIAVREDQWEDKCKKMGFDTSLITKK